MIKLWPCSLYFRTTLNCTEKYNKQVFSNHFDLIGLSGFPNIQKQIV